MDPRDRLIVALDVSSLADAEAVAERVRGLVRWFKIGSSLFTAAGPAAVAAIGRYGRIFLDTKFHDIPSVVAAAVDAAARQGIALCTVHASGGTAMMRAARAAADAAAGGTRLRVIGVTLLTSSGEGTLAETGVAEPPGNLVARLARLAKASGLDGAVTSPLEVQAVRAECGREFLLVCPGVRRAGEGGDDQRRVRSAGATVAAGADMLVVGRPITRASDPRRAAEAILREMEEALANS